jgi:hypothetical protein
MATLRSLLVVCVAGLVLCSRNVAVAHADGVATSRFRAVAFDYFVLFNPDSVVPGTLKNALEQTVVTHKKRTMEAARIDRTVTRSAGMASKG